MFRYSVVLVLALCSSLAVSAAVTKDFGSVLPRGFGMEVYGYQDDFSGGLNPAWTWVGASTPTYAISTDGRNVLQIGSQTAMNGAAGGMNHLLYAPMDCDYTQSRTQEVLMRVQMTTIVVGSVDSTLSWRSVGGAAVAVGASNNMNLMFYKHQTGGGLGGSQPVRFRSSGAMSAGTLGGGSWEENQTNSDWELNTWYWLRLVYDTSTKTATASFWPADGFTDESTAATGSWTYASAPGLGGLAGILAPSAGGTASFEVDYILILADGLPLITVGQIPEPATMSLLALGGLALLRRRRRRR